MKNYYKVLGISINASNDDIRNAYKQLRQQYHPSVNNEDRYTVEQFIDISVAYKTLSNKAKRDDYNRILNSLMPLSKSNTPYQENSYTGGTGPTPAANRYNRYGISIAFILVMAIAATIAYSIFKKDKPLNLKNENQATAVATVDHPVKFGSKVIALPGEKPVKHEITSTPTVIDNSALVNNKKGLLVPISSSTIIHATKKPALINKKSKEEIVVSTMPIQYTIGADRNSVLRIQGSPSEIIAYDNEDEVWMYGNSKLHFRNNKLFSYSNSDSNLLVQ